jgi:succinate--hydroxymethylglutarate CoA-transferase
VYPQQPFPPSATSAAGLFSRAEANPSAPINFIRKIAPGSSATLAPQYTSPYNLSPQIQNTNTSHSLSAAPASLQSQTMQHIQDDDAEGEEESRESTPASPPYPRPGNGLMAKLPPDDQDLEWLVGGGEDDAAFSHMVFDDDGGMHKVTGL